MGKALKVIKKVDVEMKLTSMIDVTFLLLIFFMVTAKFKETEGSIAAFLPKDRGLGTASAEVVTETRVNLLWHDLNANRPTTDEHGRAVLMVNRRTFPTTVYQGDVCRVVIGPNEVCRQNHGSPDFEELRDFLIREQQEWLANPPPGADIEKGMPVIIDARAKVPWTYIVRALNACQDAGIRSVTFAALESPLPD